MPGSIKTAFAAVLSSILLTAAFPVWSQGQPPTSTRCASLATPAQGPLDPQQYLADQMALHPEFRWESKLKGKWWILIDSESRREVGSVMFNVFAVTPGVLEIESIGVNDNYQGRKLSYLFMAKALSETPGTLVIPANLGGSNHETFFRELRGDDLESAIRESNAFKIRARFGFDQISNIKIEKSSPEAEFPHVSFTATRAQTSAKKP